MKNQTNPNFNLAFHGLRGLASLMVFISHSMNGYILHIAPEYTSTYIHVISNIGTFGVEIFFFLSGFVIYSASLRTNIKDFFLHRFWRIYPVFLLFTVLYFILNHYLQIIPARDNLFYFIINILFLNIYFNTPSLTPNSWSVIFEIWYYVATYTVVHSLISKKYHFNLLIGLCIAFYFIIYYPITVFYLLGVLASIFVKKYQTKIVNINTYPVNILHFFSLIIILVIASKDYQYTWKLIANDFTISVIFISLFTFIILLFNTKSFITNILSNKVLLYLGTVSYTLYLGHPYSYIFVRKIVEHFNIYKLSPEYTTILFVILLSIFTFILVWVIHIYFEAYIYRKMTGKKLLLPINNKT